LANWDVAGHLLYSVVLTLIRKHCWWFAATTVAAILLRLFFVFKLPLIAGDTLIYGDIAKCLVNNHIFGIERASGWEPTLIRLPGYPFFLAFTFLVAGIDHYIGAMLFQLFFDLLTCYLVADIARRVFGQRAARSAFLLAAFCPFLMSYVATPLTECLEVFTIAAAIDCAVIALERNALRWWAACGAACAGAILLRPDGGLILICIALPVLARAYSEGRPTQGMPGNRARRRELITATLLLSAVSLAPLLPWTIRNWRVFHVFQPLVTLHASDPGEFVPLGWERWIKTWLIDYASVEDVAFRVPGDPIDVGDIPDRAYSSSEQRALVHSLIDRYNVDHQMAPELDRHFAALARENIGLHPLRYYLLLPAARMVDMWLRPRTEMLPLDVHFWEIGRDPHDALCAIALGLLNLAYVAAAVAAAWLLRRKIKYLGLLLTYPVVRSLFLAATGASEDRYTLECYPFVFVLAAGFLCWWHSRNQTSEVEALENG
jgi:4-amino-4-deoxy-L-arabinose transferase-like glycosyltransferase